MKQIIKTLFLLKLFLLFSSTTLAQTRIVTTLPVFASIVKEITQDKAEIISLAKAEQDPHFLDAKPSYVVKLNQADILISGGLGLEDSWLLPIVRQARNPKIQVGQNGFIDASKGIQVLEAGQTSRIHGDVHPYGNPHTWLNPYNAKIMAVNFYQHLSQINPEQADFYKTNLKKFLSKLNQALSKWEFQSKNWKSKSIITYHKTWSYFAEWTGLQIINTLESKAGIPPSSSHLLKIKNEIKNKKIKVILMADYYNTKVAKKVIGDSTVSLLIRPTNVKTNESYIAFIEKLIQEIDSKL